jgi:hypothetical protein
MDMEDQSQAYVILSIEDLEDVRYASIIIY